MSSCLLCNSARVLISGPRIGALWCVMKSRSVGADFACHSFVETEAADGRDHVLVKSDPKAHFDPFSFEESDHASV